jgi:hypothetical protein
MSGGIDWFRWHHGSVTDPKFQLVARKSGASLADVVAIWAYLLERASSADERGKFGEVDFEAVDCLFNFPPESSRTQAVMRAMDERGLTLDGEVVAWDKRQVKRERESDSSAERMRALRERQAAKVTPSDATVTPSDASVTQKEPRGEESREENTIPNTEDPPTPQAPEPTPTPPAKPATRAKRSQSVSDPEPLPEWVDVEAWEGWVESRKVKRNPLTQAARKLAIRDLEKLRGQGQDAKAVIEQSTLRGWTGLFPVKAELNGHGPPARQSAHSGFDLIDYSEGVDEHGRIL